MMQLEKISNIKHQSIAILIDPEKVNDEIKLKPLLDKINFLNPGFIFVGGSTVDTLDFNFVIEFLKANTRIPVIIFPGSTNQIHKSADAILFLSLISGRNPDYLIGHHVDVAFELKKMNIEVIPTGYILIDGGKNSSVQYVSQTTPIPSDQNSIAVKTAIAGELLGLKCIFLDAGSGAVNSVSIKMIQEIRRNIQVPIIIGGGLKTIKEIKETFAAGANVVVIGNKIEEEIDFLLDLVEINKEICLSK